MSHEINEILIKIKQERPFIFNSTNFFPLGFVASGVRSLGAFPIFSNEARELEDLLKLSKSIVIHLSVLDDEFLNLCNRICKIGNKLNIPIILDPVGAGASKYRTDAALGIINKHKISIIRAYPNELSGLLNGQSAQLYQQVIDHTTTLQNAKTLSHKHNLLVVVSGNRHILIDADKVDQFYFDSQILQKVAGIGSLLSAIIGVFHAIEKDRFIAAQLALDFYANCVGPASSKVSGPASLVTELIDQLYISSHKAVVF